MQLMVMVSTRCLLTLERSLLPPSASRLFTASQQISNFHTNSQELARATEPPIQNRPQRRKTNLQIARHTDFIKHATIALVKYERVQTTIQRAKLLEQYGNLLIELALRKQPPPDLFMIENGFLIRPDEAEEKFTTRRLINRKWKKRIIYPKPISEEDFKARCALEVKNILLADQEAMTKLYGELADRFRGTYGGYVKVTPVPFIEKAFKNYPPLAFVEYNWSGLPELPPMPEIKDYGTFKQLTGRPREFTLTEIEEYKQSRGEAVEEDDGDSLLLDTQELITDGVDNRTDGQTVVEKSNVGFLAGLKSKLGRIVSRN